MVDTATTAITLTGTLTTSDEFIGNQSSTTKRLSLGTLADAQSGDKVIGVNGSDVKQLTPKMVMISDYQEGSWTPTITGSTTTGTNSYTSNTGNYVKIGKLVFVNFVIELDGTSGALDSTGTIRIEGLPFAPIGSTRFVGAVKADNISLSVSGAVMCRNVTSNTYLVLDHQTTTGTSGLAHTEATDSMELRGSIQYEVSV